MSTELVEVDRFANRIEAGIAQSQLEAAGIPAIVAADDCGGLRPEFQFSRGVAVLVAAANLGRAREVLVGDSDEESDEDA